ncbi:hypothetical protein ACIQ2D_15525 [Lysinibacillus sp. NPDC097287]|uniref:hypothetical protein n=1 Tax=Lysinibacillus sp. NPDC097287 TaxID=3364144 RepID=UPI0038128983
MLVVVLALTACNSELAITELNSVPKKLQKVLDQLRMDDYIQLVNDGEEIAYIAVNTKGTVTASVESNDDKIFVNIEEVEGQNEEIKQYIFKLTKDKDYEYMYLNKNGEEIPFDVVTGI